MVTPLWACILPPTEQCVGKFIKFVSLIIIPERAIHTADAVRFSNPGGQSVMWWAQSAPLDWNMVK